MKRPLRLGAALLVMAMVAIACSDTELPDIDEAGPTTTSATPPPPPDPSAPSAPLPTPDPPPTADDFSGRLAVLGPTGELLVRNGTEWDRWSRPDAIVGQLGWSPDGTEMAWTEVTPTSTRLVSGEGPTPETLETERTPFFVWWTPDGDQVSHLGSTDGVVSLALSEPSMSPELVAASTPLFYSWSPGGRLVIHQGGQELNLVENGSSRLLARTSAAFQAPAWLDDQRVVALVEREGGDALAVIDVDENVVTPLFEVDGNIVFAVSPDGTRIAYQILDQAGAEASPVRADTAQEGEPDPPDVLVLDLDTQEVALAFVGQARWLDWSPDSTSLAALIDADEMTWRIWSDTELVRTEALTISPVMAETFVPFFDQYTQAITGWSPDSARYAFAAAIGDETGVYLLESAVGGEVTRIGDGVVVAWAPAPP